MRVGGVFVDAKVCAVHEVRECGRRHALWGRDCLGLLFWEDGLFCGLEAARAGADLYVRQPLRFLLQVC